MKTIKNLFTISALLFSTIYLPAQVGINSNGTAPATSAMLDISSATKGFLLPRMTIAQRNAIVAPANGLMIYNTQTDEFNYFNGANWQSMASGASNFWGITGTSIYNSNTGNVGIGDTSPTNAKFEVSGAVNGQVALFKYVSGVSIDGTNAPSIGFNYNNGNAISTGAGGLLTFKTTPSAFNSGSISLDFYKSKTAGSLFTLPKNILKFQDFTDIGLGNWLDLNNLPDSRINVSDRMYSKSNGNMNLIPLGAINFRVTGFGAGSNAPKIINNVGQNADLYQNVQFFDVDTGSGLGNGYMILNLNLDFITKSYDNVYIVGSPNFANIGEETQTAYARFLRNPAGTSDKIQIYYQSSFINNDAEVFGTLLVYGTKSD